MIKKRQFQIVHVDLAALRESSPYLVIDDDDDQCADPMMKWESEKKKAHDLLTVPFTTLSLINTILYTHNIE